MVVGKVRERLERCSSVGVERYTIFTRGVEVLECVYRRLVVLVRRRLLVRGKKGKAWGNIWSRTRGKPVD